MARISDSRNPPPLIGREREQAIVRDALAGALAGRGSLVLIGGEAGIGKTALAEEICREAAAQGALVLVGRCYDLTETPPYGPWVELFGRHHWDEAMPAVPSVFARGGTVGEVSSPATLSQQVLDFFAARTARQPMVLLFDDLHWADPASLDLLRILARQAPRWSMLVLATYRREAVDARHPLYALIPTLVREADTERLDLRALSDDIVQALVDRRYGLPPADAIRLSRYVQQRAEGNPFFIGEVLRALQEEDVLQQTATGWLLDELVDVRVPALVRQVIGLRIRRLDAETQRLLSIAAVIGQEVPFAVWQAVAETDTEALLSAAERAEAAYLVAGTSDGLRMRFVHALIRETLYEGITAARRRHWHLQAAEVLAAIPDADADAVAYHFAQAGDERAVTWLVRAGEAAQRAYAWLTAAQRYEAALARLDPAGEPSDLQATLYYRVGQMISYSDPARAIGYMDAVQQIATLRADRALIASARLNRGLSQALSGALEPGLSDLAAGVAAMDTLAPADIVRLAELEIDRPLLDSGRGPLTTQLARAGRVAEVVAIAKDMPSTYRSIATSNALGIKSVSLGLGIARALLGEPEAAVAAFAEKRSERLAAGDYHVLGFVSLVEMRMVALAHRAEDLARRRQLAQEGEQAWTKALGVTPDLSPRFPALPHLLLEGHWSEVREVALTVLESKFAVMRVHAMSMLGPLARAQGDAALAWAQVHALFPDGLATRPGTVPFFEALILQCLASALASDAGDYATASTWLAMHDAWLAWNGAVLGRADGNIAWARHYRAVGDPDAAIHHAEEALTCATEPRQPLVLLAAHRLLGHLNSDAGRFAAAEAHLTDALALADACAASYERALTLLAIAELRAASNRGAEVRALIDEARAICVPLDAKPALARADALAARLSAAPATPDGLTAREIEVLRLLAGGSTIRQIAATLFLSPRTVERHITTIYRKIDARGRVDATAYALRNGLAAARPHDS